MARKKNDLGRDPVGGLVLKLAVPTMLAQLINVLYSIVDRMYIGHIADVGGLALAGVGVCGPIVTLLSSFAFLVCQGGTPIMAMRMGEGDMDRAEHILSNCLRMLLVFSAALGGIFFVLRKQLLWWFGASADTFPYALTYITIYIFGSAFALLATGLNSFLICQGRPGLGMATVILGAVMNIALDPVFIFALDMGVAGAAVATVISQACSCLFVLLALRKRSMPLRFRWGKFHWGITKRVLAFGVSPFLTIASDSVLLIILNTVLQRYGGPGEGDVLLTCATIVQSFMLLVTMPLGGATLGSQSVVSFNYGAGRPLRVKQALKSILGVCLVFSGVMLAIAYTPLSTLFVRLFTTDPVLIARSVVYIKIYTAGLLFLAVQYVVVDQSVALGQVRLALFCSMFRKSLFLIFTLVLPLAYAAGAAFWAEPLCDAIAALVSGGLFLHFIPAILARLSPGEN